MAWFSRFMVRARRGLGEINPYRIVKVQKSARKAQRGELPKAEGRGVSYSAVPDSKPKFTKPKTERLYKAVLERRKEANEILARY